MILSIVVVMWMACCVGVYGEETKGGKRFRVACWSDWKGEAVFFSQAKRLSEESMVPVDLMEMAYSGYYPYKAGVPIRFYQRGVKVPYRMIEEVKVPSGVHEPLIFFFVSGEGKLKYRVFDTSSRKFPFGSYQFVNLSKEDMMVKFTGKPVMLRAQSAKVIDSFANKKKAYPCRVARKEATETKVVYSSMIMHRPNKRMMMFLYPGVDEAKRSKMRTRALVDYRASGS
ncbi:hypothetical protein [Rubritalea tangerina]|uniref:hypothetical protein n=1 Tax=Rubritalea tangerina TaxID=430798 RepID=UPI003607571B